MTDSITVKPYAPGPLTAIALTPKSIELDWSANPNNSGVGDLEYYFEYSTNGKSFSPLGYIAGSATTAIVDGLKKKKTYYFRMAAYSASYGTSDYSNTPSAKTPKK